MGATAFKLPALWLDGAAAGCVAAATLRGGCIQVSQLGACGRLGMDGCAEFCVSAVAQGGIVWENLPGLACWVAAGVCGGARDSVGSFIRFVVGSRVRVEPNACSCGSRRSGGAGHGSADDGDGIVTEDLSAGRSDHRRTIRLEFDGIDAAGGGADADAAENNWHQGAGHCDLGHVVVLCLCAVGFRSGGGQGWWALSLVADWSDADRAAVDLVDHL